jgi:hypothetical protein
MDQLTRFWLIDFISEFSPIRKKQQQKKEQKEKKKEKKKICGQLVDGSRTDPLINSTELN